MRHDPHTDTAVQTESCRLVRWSFDHVVFWVCKGNEALKTNSNQTTAPIKNLKTYLGSVYDETHRNSGTDGSIDAALGLLSVKLSCWLRDCWLLFDLSMILKLLEEMLFVDEMLFLIKLLLWLHPLEMRRDVVLSLNELFLNILLLFASSWKLVIFLVEPV